MLEWKLLVVLSIQYDKFNYIHVLRLQSGFDHAHGYHAGLILNSTEYKQWKILNLEVTDGEKNMHIVNTYINTIQSKI